MSRESFTGAGNGPELPKSPNTPAESTKEKTTQRESRKLFEDLKKTPLYDPEKRQWNRAIKPDQTTNDPRGRAILMDYSLRPAAAQLLGALAEEAYDPAAAAESYQQLKETALYDKRKKQWNYSMRADQEPDTTMRSAQSQLLGVLLESKFNRGQAKKLYEQLKKTPLYDADRDQWQEYMSPYNDEVKDDNRSSMAQLLDVLVQADFDPRAAKKKYEALKKTPLYDPDRRQWRLWIKPDQNVDSDLRPVTAQLLGILAESKFNPAKAKTQYDNLKRTNAFDTEHRQWREYLYNQKRPPLRINPERLATTQLAGILVEQALERSATDRDR